MLVGVGTIGHGIAGMDQTGVGITDFTTIGIMAMEEEVQTKTTLWVVAMQTEATLTLLHQEEEEQPLELETLQLEPEIQLLEQLETILLQDQQILEQEIQTLQLHKQEIIRFVLHLLHLETILKLQEVILILEHVLIQTWAEEEVLLVDLAEEAMVAEAEDLAEVEDVNKF